jgi:hypothetical protein
VLTGTNMNGTRRYRHAPGINCGTTNRSVACDILHDEFAALMEILTIDPHAVDMMTELTIQAQRLNGQISEADLEQQKIEAIALCERRIDAAVVLFGDGMIDEDEYWLRVDENRREIAHWQTRTTETEKLALEFAMCIDVVNTMASRWRDASLEDKQGMARNLFNELVFDLDTHRIVGFKLKAWADRGLHQGDQIRRPGERGHQPGRTHALDDGACRTDQIGQPESAEHAQPQRRQYSAAWRGRLAVLRHAADPSRTRDDSMTAASCPNPVAGSCASSSSCDRLSWCAGGRPRPRARCSCRRRCPARTC